MASLYRNDAVVSARALGGQMIPISSVRCEPAEERAVLEVLRSGKMVQGDKVAELESGFADICPAPHAIAVNNGTTALEAALAALDLGPDDEVITSAFTFGATVNAILHTGARARLVDISPHDFNLCPKAVCAAITDRTRAIMPVHMYGQCADMTALSRIARRHDLAVIEDAAQAHGATVDGQYAGTFGTGCFSFYATKNITTVEGGLITTADDGVAEWLRLMRNQGMSHRYRYRVVGHNWRMTDMQAALALPQLPRYGEVVKQRRANAATLSTGLAQARGLRLPQVLPGRGHVWHQYTVLLDDGAALDRDQLSVALAQRAIASAIYYPRPLGQDDCFATHPKVSREPIPVASDCAARCLSLPVHPDLTEDDLHRIIAGVVESLGV